jgi:enoyl-CoA hydratase/carnithine racemase
MGVRVIELEERGPVRVVHWRDGENRFNRNSLDRWDEVLTDLESIDGPLAVVITGEGKFFSNGLDLEALVDRPGELGGVIAGLHGILARLLVFPAYTVAAINGHAFAAGAMFASVLDARVMRDDRGYWCLPEVDLGLPLTKQMTAAVTARLPLPAVLDAMLTGRRYGAAEAVAAGLVDEKAPEVDVVERAVERAAAIANKDRSVIATHKKLVLGSAALICADR